MMADYESMAPPPALKQKIGPEQAIAASCEDATVSGICSQKLFNCCIISCATQQAREEVTQWNVYRYTDSQFPCMHNTTPKPVRFP